MPCNETWCEPSSYASSYSCKMTIKSENPLKSITKIGVQTEKHDGRMETLRTDGPCQNNIPPPEICRRGIIITTQNWMEYHEQCQSSKRPSIDLSLIVKSFSNPFQAANNTKNQRLQTPCSWKQQTLCRDSNSQLINYQSDPLPAAPNMDSYFISII